MKKLFLSIISIVTVAASTFGQSPEGFKYQAVIRNTSNTILTNQAVGIQIEILQGSITGTSIYTETFATTTNNYGLVNLEIGTGTTTNNFSTINWGGNSYFVRTSIDVTGGNSFVAMGTNQLMSVPYALYSKTAENVLNDLVNDADSDPSNEIQDIALSGTNLTLSGGSTIDLSVIDTQLDEVAVDAMVANNGFLTSPNDADSDPANELQDISLSGSNLTLTGGSTIDLSAIDTDTQLDSAGISALGFVAGSHKVVDYLENSATPTGRYWIDGKQIFQITFVKAAPAYLNWSIFNSTSFETIVDIEYTLVSDVPFANSRTHNSPFAFVTQDNPTGNGWLVMSTVNGTSLVDVGSTITVYYTLP